MAVSDRYKEAWESYWRETPEEPGAAVWDCDASLSVKPHLALFEPFVDGSKPVVDLGCGSGTTTRFLAERFARVVGVDISHAAVEHARRADLSGTAEFRQLNAAEPGEVGALHGELGDADVYMRAVIHQSEPAARPAIAEAVAALAGRGGRAFVVEPLAVAKSVIADTARGAGGPPPKIARVFAHGLTPAETEDEAVPELLRATGLSVLASGRIDLVMTEYRADGSRIDLPAQWLVVGR
ncbi:methyltransferase domain-containing protein [Streptantibioticus parmotrematis]|uniref:class I SAM-dependent methyltransferase n=1 Tax=Streptantibioticus parmotrematis TaxID=2873249 RepID=UPI0033F6146C